MTKEEIIKRFEELESEIKQQKVIYDQYIHAYGALQAKVAILEQFISTQPLVSKGGKKELAQ